MKNFFREQINEIRTSKLLVIYGCIICFFQTLTAFQWLQGNAADLLKKTTDVICWPMFENCANWRFLNFQQGQIVFGLFMAWSIATILFFILKKFNAAYYSMILINIIKILIVFMDYRFRLNQHIMIFWISFAYLFLPYKAISIQLFIPFFYFWAGILKLTPEWLSGASLYNRMWLFEGKTIQWACHYVVILELFLIWGIFAKKMWLRMLTWFQLILFHTFSFTIVGFFYPVLMYCMLLIYPLAWYYGQSVIFPPKFSHLKIGTVSCLVFFAFTQMLPKFLGRDTSLTGEGRLFALHMFDAKIICESYAILKRSDGLTQYVNLKSPLSPRLTCDPAVFLHKARWLCKIRNELQNGKKFDDFDWILRSRHSNEMTYKTIVTMENFCESKIRYSIFTKNKWIALDAK